MGKKERQAFVYQTYVLLKLAKVLEQLTKDPYDFSKGGDNLPKLK